MLANNKSSQNSLAQSRDLPVLWKSPWDISVIGAHYILYYKLYIETCLTTIKISNVPSSLTQISLYKKYKAPELPHTQIQSDRDKKP